MSIGSIDAITLAPRTVNAADSQGREANQNQHILDQNAVQFQQNVEREARQTVEAQESETEDYDGEGSGGKAGQKNPAKKKKKDNTQGQKMAPRSTSSFDIMI
ncbi:MAG: hypothetical protein MR304_11805 [Eubacterium sp.]|nr:hypothetical protein [Eubacterium sp.]